MRHASSLSQIVASERLPDSRLKLVVQGLGRVQCLRATRVTTREYVTYLQDNLASSCGLRGPLALLASGSVPVFKKRVTYRDRFDLKVVRLHIGVGRAGGGRRRSGGGGGGRRRLPSDPSRAPPRPLPRGARAPIHLGTTFFLVLIVAPVR